MVSASNLMWTGILVIIYATATTAQSNLTENKCSNGTRACQMDDTLLIPVWQPLEPTGTGDVAGRAIVYLLVLCYLFLGVSIIADRFMSSIEVITSQEKDMVVQKANGDNYTIQVRVWNETVSNLTLMALGSSAPEILLSIIEICGNKFQAGQLGPGTIVGSAAFNLFVIIGICILVIPAGEFRRILHLGVFWVTATWSVFAYIWLYLMIAVISEDKVDVWEGVLTFVFFILTVLTAYMADKKVFTRLPFLQKRYKEKDGHFSRPGTASKKPGDFEMTNGLAHSASSEVLVAREFEKHRQEYIEIFKDMRSKNPDADIQTIERLAETEAIRKGPKSRAFYRIQATRQLTGGGNITKKAMIHEETLKSIKDASLTIQRSDDYGIITVYFDPSLYTCLENIGTQYMNVRCDRNGVIAPVVVLVDFKTEDGTANAPDDYIATQGTLEFRPDETMKNIAVDIIDNELFEDDEFFTVTLENVRLIGADKVEEQEGIVRSKLKTPFQATVIILDNDHSGVFEFEKDIIEVAESIGDLEITVKRRKGARGKVRVPFRTIGATAKPGSDYIDTFGELVFHDEDSEDVIKVRIMNDDSYEKAEHFFVELDEPLWENPFNKTYNHDPTEGISAEELAKAEEGKPELGNVKKCKIVIKESVEFKNFIDKLAKRTNASLMVGSSSWKEQFIEAITVQAGGDGDNGDPDAPENLPGCFDYVMHALTMPWKLVFAFVPPTDYFNGWACFVVSISLIGFITALIGDFATLFGCTVGLKPAVTSISIVALGTSLPDTFASKVAALQDQYADSSIVNVTGSNAVNVFLGIGIAWMIAAIYHEVQGTKGGFVVKKGSLGFSVTLFCVGAVFAILILTIRRCWKGIGAELGGPSTSKTVSAVILFCIWFAYLILSSLQAYCYIDVDF